MSTANWCRFFFLSTSSSPLGWFYLSLRILYDGVTQPFPLCEQSTLLTMPNISKKKKPPRTEHIIFIICNNAHLSAKWQYGLQIRSNWSRHRKRQWYKKKIKTISVTSKTTNDKKQTHVESCSSTAIIIFKFRTSPRRHTEHDSDERQMQRHTYTTIHHPAKGVTATQPSANWLMFDNFLLLADSAMYERPSPVSKVNKRSNEEKKAYRITSHMTMNIWVNECRRIRMLWGWMCVIRLSQRKKSLILSPRLCIRSVQARTYYYMHAVTLPNAQ